MDEKQFYLGELMLIEEKLDNMDERVFDDTEQELLKSIKNNLKKLQGIK